MDTKPVELVIPEVSRELFLAMTPGEQDRYLQLYREQVPAPFEEWRNYHRVKLAYGGRGAGAKSRSSASLLIQFAENPGYFGKSIRVLCVRDVQKSIKESSWQLLKDELERLKYVGWKVTEDKLINLKNGSYFTFAGLNNLSKDNLKSLASYDILYAEEAAPIDKDSWLTIQATFRKPLSELWIIYNRDKTMDPCHELFATNPDPSWSIIACRPGRLDNPWFPEILQKEWDRLKETDPDEALHVYEGMPRMVGDRAIYSQRTISAMQDREIDDHGAIQIGCDVARFGKDSTVAFKRKGMRVIDKREVKGFDTVDVAGMIWNELAERDPSILIAIDAGYNPGVIDVLLGYGANVIAINFGGNANDEDKYANRVSEMYFELPVDELSIPGEFMTQELFEDLTERLFSYDTRGRKKIEPKDGDGKTNFKSRHGGRSPDCFIAGTKIKTAFGDKNIEDIKPGDYVYTPFGVEKVIKNWETKTSNLTTVYFSNGEILTGKGKHRVFTINGFIPLDRLHNKIVQSFSLRRILKWLLKSLLSIKARNITFKQAVDIITAERAVTEQDFFTGIYGLTTMGQFRKDTMCTILMKIGLTITYPILVLFHEAIICLNTQKKDSKINNTGNKEEKTWKSRGNMQKNGIHQKMVLNGTANTELNRGREEKKLKQSVILVGRSFIHIFQQEQSTVRKAVSIDTQGKTAGRLKKFALFAGKISKLRLPMSKERHVVADRVDQKSVIPTRVYNLTLEKHNAYFANNILVENCGDALVLTYAQEAIGGIF